MWSVQQRGGACSVCGKPRRLVALLVVLVLLVVGMLAFPPVRLTASAVDQAECSLVVNGNRVSVTVSRGPCTTANFPAWCDGFVPRVIVQGQTIPCEVVVVTATPTRSPAPAPTSAPTRTPTPVPLLQRLRNGIPVLSWSDR